MGELTRAQMEAQVKFRSGNRTDIDSQITLAVQFAYDELVTAIRVPENQETAVISLNTAALQNIYPMPPDIYIPVSVRNTTDGKSLDLITSREYDREKDTTTRQEPKKWLWWRNELIIQPPNDTTPRTLLLRFVKRLAALSTSTTKSSLSREWDEVIIQGAFYRLLNWLDLHDDAAKALNAYGVMVSSRIGRLSEFERKLGGAAAPQLIDKTAAESGWSN